MLSFEIWIAFVFASAVVLAIPGPTVMLVVSYALSRGRASGWSTVPGVALGDLTAMTASLAGAGAILAASAELFTILKLVGAAYLIWRGIRLWRAKAGAEGFEGQGPAKTHRSMFVNAYVVTALNPKSIAFFVAFVPQFIDPDAPLLGQFAILEATFVTLAALNVGLWVVMVGKLRERFRRHGTLRLVNRVGGTCLIGAGVLTATLRRV